MSLNLELTHYYYLRFKTGKTSLKVMRNNKCTAKKNLNLEHYIAISAAIAMVEAEQLI